mgnify:CR=1 FL=1
MLKSFILVGVVASQLLSAPSKCPTFFANGETPDFLTKNVELCFEQFTIGYSTDKKNPLYAAEVLTPESIKAGDAVKRKDEFHQEPLLPKDKQSLLPAYVGTKYDRGHLVPAADMSTVKAQYQSFSMSNMTPQYYKNNRGMWKKLEVYTRNVGAKYKKTYMISGPIFTKTDSKMKDGTVIPNGYYKIIYVPEIQMVSSFYTKNLEGQPEDEKALVPVTEIEKMTGYKFPQIPENLKTKPVMEKF